MEGSGSFDQVVVWTDASSDDARPSQRRASLKTLPLLFSSGLQRKGQVLNFAIMQNQRVVYVSAIDTARLAFNARDEAYVTVSNVTLCSGKDPGLCGGECKPDVAAANCDGRDFVGTGGGTVLDRGAVAGGTTGDSTTGGSTTGTTGSTTSGTTTGGSQPAAGTTVAIGSVENGGLLYRSRDDRVFWSNRTPGSSTNTRVFVLENNTSVVRALADIPHKNLPVASVDSDGTNVFVAVGGTVYSIPLAGGNFTDLVDATCVALASDQLVLCDGGALISSAPKNGSPKTARVQTSPYVASRLVTLGDTVFMTTNSQTSNFARASLQQGSFVFLNERADSLVASQDLVAWVSPTALSLFRGGSGETSVFPLTSPAAVSVSNTHVAWSSDTGSNTEVWVAKIPTDGVLNSTRIYKGASDVKTLALSGNRAVWVRGTTVEMTAFVP